MDKDQKKNNSIFLALAIVSAVGLCLAGYFFVIKDAGINISPKISQLSEFLESDNPYQQALSLEHGPLGFNPTSVASLFSMLTDEDLGSFSDQHYTVAIAMHDLDSDWSKLQIRGIQEVLEFVGIEIIAITDGELSVEKQVVDYKYLLTLNPDILITIPIDAVISAAAILDISGQGTKVIFMDSVPEGFNHPQDYVGMVMADSYANAQGSILAIVEELEQKGEVALIHWDTDMFTVNERSRAAKQVLQRFPDITVIERSFDELYNVQGVTRKLLEEYPGLDAIWVVWDTPALEAMKVIREVNADIIVGTVDLGRQLATSLASNDIVISTGAQNPYAQGVAEGIMAMVSLSAKQAPAFVVVPAELINKANIAEGWQHVFHNSISPEMQELLDR